MRLRQVYGAASFVSFHRCPQTRPPFYRKVAALLSNGPEMPSGNVR